MAPTTLDSVFQVGLAVGFLIASGRLFWVARYGRRNIRLYRIVGAVITLLWSAVYAVAAVTASNGHILMDGVRAMQYLNLMMFLLWGFLFNEERWEEDAKARLEEFGRG